MQSTNSAAAVVRPVQNHGSRKGTPAIWILDINLTSRRTRRVYNLMHATRQVTMEEYQILFDRHHSRIVKVTLSHSP